MTYKNRYQKAAYALEWATNNNETHKEAALRFGVHRKQLISNVSSLKHKRPDLYQRVYEGTMSYDFAYRTYRSEV